MTADSVYSSAFPLTQTNLEDLLHTEDTWSYLPVQINESSAFLCVSRAYASFNQPAPKISVSNKVSIPFAVFRKGHLTRIIPAAGLPYRLLPDYQCTLPELMSGKQEQDAFRRILPECVLQNVLNQLDQQFTDSPEDTTVQIVFMPFYIISIHKGSTFSTILINGYNADVLLEQPPPMHKGSGTFGRVFMAAGAYAGLVTLITGVWLTVNSMVFTIALTIVAAAGIRKLVALRLASG